MNPLLDQSQQDLRRAAQEAVEANIAAAAGRIEAEDSAPKELLGALGDAGLLDQGADADDRLLRIALVVEQVARKSAAMACVVAGHASAIDALAAAGADTGDHARGTRLAAVIVEGVDADAEGSLGGSCPLVYAASGCDEMLVAAGGEGAGVFRIAPAADGVEVGESGGLLGLNGSGTAEVSFSGARGERLAGADAARVLADRHRVACSAVGVGIGRGALDVAVADVEARDEEGEPVAGSQAVQWMLADIATETEAARAATWFAACAPAGGAMEEASAMSRLLAAESAVSATRRALQICGARGALRAHGVERLYRDAKVLEMQGGSNEEQLARIAGHVLPDLAGGS